MSPTLQNTRAQQNAALARSSSSTGHVINVRYWHQADIALTAVKRLCDCDAKCPLMTQSGHSAVFKKGFCDIIGTGTTETCEKPVIL